MEVDQREPSGVSTSSNLKTTVAYLKEQISYLHSKVFEKSEEIDQKDTIIRKIEAEKSEFAVKFELADVREAEAMKEIDQLKEELASKTSDSRVTIEDICKEMQDQDQYKNQIHIESDGIKCFTFLGEDFNEDSNILSASDKDQEEIKNDTPSQNIELQLK
jgi:predicted RND superfamily exporter protein